MEEKINEISNDDCFHEYIVCLGKDKETSETYDYCLSCGGRIKGSPSQAFYVDATLYLEEYPLEIELGRVQKLAELRRQFSELMLENGETSPAYVIDEFRDIVELKRNQLYQVRGKVC